MELHVETHRDSWAEVEAPVSARRVAAATLRGEVDASVIVEDGLGSRPALFGQVVHELVLACDAVDAVAIDLPIPTLGSPAEQFRIDQDRAERNVGSSRLVGIVQKRSQVSEAGPQPLQLGGFSIGRTWIVAALEFDVPAPPNKSVDRKGDRIKRNVWRSRYHGERRMLSCG